MQSLQSLGWGCAMAALLWACSSGNAQQEAPADDAAGSAHGGSQAGGSAGSHAAGNGGSSTAGNAGNHSVGVGGASSQGCHDSSECPGATTPPFGGITMCLTPGQARPSGGCGIPQWCGQCSCPPQPQAPTGTGTPCQTSQDCPTANANSASASVCNAGVCTACAQDSDCPGSLPVCGQVIVQFVAGGPSPFRVCTACVTDSNCSSERPYCQSSYGISACGNCRTTADCQSGVCSSGTCAPACSPTQPCGEGQQCSAQQRCEPLSCENDAGCPTNYACTAGHCGRRACTVDTVCEGNCVNGFCFESLGTCYQFLQAA